MIEVVGATLWTSERELVMQRRAPGQRGEGLLGLYGGHVEPGDAGAAAAILREIGEEIEWPEGQQPHWWHFDQVGAYALQGTDDARYHLFSTQVPHANFKDLEGAGPELHAWPDVLARSDLTPAAQQVLTLSKVKFDRM